MKVQRKTNPNYLRRKNERLKKETRQPRIRTLEIQGNTKKNQSNMLLERNEKECRKICKRMSNLLVRTNVQRNQNKT